MAVEGRGVTSDLWAISVPVGAGVVDVVGLEAVAVGPGVEPRSIFSLAEEILDGPTVLTGTVVGEPVAPSTVGLGVRSTSSLLEASAVGLPVAGTADVPTTVGLEVLSTSSPEDSALDGLAVVGPDVRVTSSSSSCFGRPLGPAVGPDVRETSPSSSFSG